MAKTRLAAAVGARRAADLAAAALLDTLELCAEVFTSGFRVASLAGDLADARRGEELAAASEGWHVIEQRGGVWASGSATRCTRRTGSRAGRWSSSGWTRLTCRRGSSRRPRTVAATGLPVLGPAADGGWWVLATADPRRADGLADVPMSRPDTYDRTHEAVCRGARRVAPAPVMRVDTAADAAWAAVAAPGEPFRTRLAGWGPPELGVGDQRAGAGGGCTVSAALVLEVSPSDVYAAALRVPPASRPSTAGN